MFALHIVVIKKHFTIALRHSQQAELEALEAAFLPHLLIMHVFFAAGRGRLRTGFHQLGKINCFPGRFVGFTPNILSHTQGEPGDVVNLQIGKSLLNPVQGLVGEIFGSRRARGDHGCDRFSDETHHLGGQHRLVNRPVLEGVQHRPDRFDVHEVRCGYNQGVRGPGEAINASRRHWAAHEAQPMRGSKVAAEPTATRDEGRVLEPTDRTTNPPGAQIGHAHASARSSARRATTRARSRR